MKLIEIQRHYFSIKGDRRKYFCTSADTDASLNVKVVHFVDADNLRGQGEFGKFVTKRSWEEAFRAMDSSLQSPDSSVAPQSPHSVRMWASLPFQAS